VTAAERLVALAGTSGTAGALLLAIGSGATTGAALVNYSGLLTGTASEHLMTDVIAIGGGWSGDDFITVRKPYSVKFDHEDEEDLISVVALFIQTERERLQ
jgi:hypothetical protein